MMAPTACFGVSPALMRRERNSKSVRRPPRAWMLSSSSSRAFSLAAPSSWLLMCFSTKRFAGSGWASPRRIGRKMRSGRDLASDLPKDVSFVRNITWAMFAETRSAALSSKRG